MNKKKISVNVKHLICFDNNWSYDEVTHRWSENKNATLFVLNSCRDKKKVDISFELHVLERQLLKITVKSIGIKTIAFDNERNKIIQLNDVLLQPGLNEITIESNKKPSSVDGDNRTLSFAISNMILHIAFSEKNLKSFELYKRICKISGKKRAPDLFFFIYYILHAGKNNVKLDEIIINSFIDLMLSEFGSQLRSAIPDLYPWCSLMEESLVILSDGSVTTCCADPFGMNKFGSIYDDDFDKILDLYNNNLSMDKYESLQCQNCIKFQPDYVNIIATNNEKRHYCQKDIRHYPYAIYIEPIAKCNYRCDNCPVIHKDNPGAKANLEIIFEKIRLYLPYINMICLFNYGEPLLHNGIINFIERCRYESPNLNITISTNGVLLNIEYAKSFIKSKVNRIIVSVHGAPGTDNLKKYSHSGDYDKILVNIKNLLDLRRSSRADFPKIVLRAVLFNWNDSDELMDQFRMDARNLGLVNNDKDGDGYEWILDSAGIEHQRSSKKYYIGSPHFKKLFDNREIYFLTHRWSLKE